VRLTALQRVSLRLLGEVDASPNSMA